jgi:DnaJ-class molecular chaperone
LDKTKFTNESKTLSVTVPRGIAGGQKITIENEGNEIPIKMRKNGKTRSNVIIIVNESAGFSIDGIEYIRKTQCHLMTIINIDPHEAICGSFKTLRFINNDLVNIKIPKGIIFDSKRIIIVPQMGMPIMGKKKKFGDLIIHLEINNKNYEQLNVQDIWKAMTGTNMDECYNLKLEKTNNRYIESIPIDQYKNQNEEEYEDDINPRMEDNMESSMGMGEGSVGECIQQ